MSAIRDNRGKEILTSRDHLQTFSPSAQKNGDGPKPAAVITRKVLYTFTFVPPQVS